MKPIFFFKQTDLNKTEIDIKKFHPKLRKFVLEGGLYDFNQNGGFTQFSRGGGFAKHSKATELEQIN